MLTDRTSHRRSRQCPRPIRRGGRCDPFRRAVILIATALLQVIMVSCGRPAAERWAIESKPAALDDETRWKTTLTPAEQREVLQAMRTVPESQAYDPQHPPTPAPHGVRWADVPRAASAAAAEIEAAVFDTVEDDGQFIFHIRMIDDRPGTMVVTRTDDERIYELNVKIGYFGGNDELEQQLRDVFARKMKAFGKKRRFTGELAPEPER